MAGRPASSGNAALIAGFCSFYCKLQTDDMSINTVNNLLSLKSGFTISVNIKAIYKQHESFRFWESSPTDPVNCSTRF